MQGQDLGVVGGALETSGPASMQGKPGPHQSASLSGIVDLLVQLAIILADSPGS